MSAKCAYVKFMYEKCKRERIRCNIEKRLFQDCNSENMYFSGCRPQYKLKYGWINDTRKGGKPSMETDRKNSGTY